MVSIKKATIFFIVFVAGIITGGYLFRDVQPRSFLAVNDCKETCLRPNELLGLIGSVGIKIPSGLNPFIIKETDKVLVIESPIRQAPLHYVIIPKKDIKDAGDISDSDKEYLADAYAVIGQIIREKNLSRYKIYTNGPGYQTVNYLHFHLLSDKVE